MGAPPFVSRGLEAVDRFQRSNRVAGPAFAVNKKFSDDKANLYVVALGWYGFTAIYPLLLVVITIFGFIGEASLGTGWSTRCTSSRLSAASSTPRTGDRVCTAAALGW
jgi:hypothetical protein